MYYAINNKGVFDYVHQRDMPKELLELTDEERFAIGIENVVYTDKPIDTETTTYDISFELVNGVHTVLWIPRPKTNEELIVDSISKQVDVLNTLLGVSGTANMTTLRGLKATTNAEINSNSAKYIKALIDIIIDLVKAEKQSSRVIAKRFENIT